MNCDRKGKWFRSCTFEPRYDEGIADLRQFKTVDRMTDWMLDKFRPKTYVHDVCITCGKVVYRDGTKGDGR